MPERSAAGLVWRMAFIREPHKADKMAAIHEALEKCSAENSVFYQDEVSINRNPKIGSDWQVRRQQKHVMTIGQNEKDYLAGHGASKVSYVGGSSKNSALCISLLKRPKVMYRRAKNLTLIVDNYHYPQKP